MLVCPPVALADRGGRGDGGRAGYCRQHLQSFAEVRDIVLSELRALEPLCTTCRRPTARSTASCASTQTPIR